MYDLWVRLAADVVKGYVVSVRVNDSDVRLAAAERALRRVVGAVPAG